MRLIINLDSLTPPRTGIGRYTASLLEEYLARPREKMDVTGLYHGRIIGCREELWALLCSRPQRSATTAGKKSPLWRILGGLPGARRMRRGLRNHRYRNLLKAAAKGGVIHHEPNYVALDLHAPLVVTVHDLSHLRHPEYHPQARVKWLRRELPATLDRAGKIITVSEFSRRELISLLGLAEEKILAIPLGRDERFRPQEPKRLAYTLRQWGLRPGGYLASVGTLEPRKNLPRLLRAYGRLPGRLRQAYPLVLAGPAGWHMQQLTPQLESLRRRGEVRWLGYLDEGSLPAFYGGAALFVYVSLYEGFGLPVLEAMSCEVPVLTSAESAMSSWAEDGVLLVDPLDTDAISRALTTLLEDRALAGELAAKGRARSVEFSWRRCAKETLAVYRQTMDDP